MNDNKSNKFLINTDNYVILMNSLQIGILTQNWDYIQYVDIDNRILTESSNYYRVGSVRIAIFTYYYRFSIE